MFDDIVVRVGRYGPYLERVRDGVSQRANLPDDLPPDELTPEVAEQLFTVTLDEALQIYAQPKQRGRQSAAAAPPLRELGTDPATKKPMVIKDGRFGPYVTDGETNASLRKGDEVEKITDERAAELLAERRARGPAPKKTTARKPATRKKAPAK